jgi:hypothetical protein
VPSTNLLRLVTPQRDDLRKIRPIAQSKITDCAAFTTPASEKAPRTAWAVTRQVAFRTRRRSRAMVQAKSSIAR